MYVFLKHIYTYILKPYIYITYTQDIDVYVYT
jgi:hypothetical protein